MMTIQELLGGSGLIGGERKIAITGVLEGSHSPPLSSSTTTTTTTVSSSVRKNQNLRCPRCDSSNTKFCYYNNYNLTQPRHFCKTCRRHWTKGGALRNVPIGGGGRKNKNVIVTPSSVGKSSPGTGRLKTVSLSSEIGNSGPSGGFDQELPTSNPILRAQPQNSHFLALLRASQNLNPNPNPNPISNCLTVKEESVMVGSQLTSESTEAAGALNAQTLGLDPFNQSPSMDLCSSFWRSNRIQVQVQAQPQQQNHHHQQRQTGFALGEVQNTGIHEFYQRLRTTDNYYPDHSPVLLMSNVASSSSSSYSNSTILESAPVSAAELGYWKPALSWSDLQTANAAYPQ